MWPRSSFRSGGTCERTLVPVFVPGEHPIVPSFRFSFRGNIRQNHPFGEPPFLATPEKRQESATFLQLSVFNSAVQFFGCCGAAFGQNDVRIAEKRMLQCNFCSATFRKLQRNFCFGLWHVAGVGFRGMGFRTC